MPTPTQQNTADIATISADVKVFRATTGQSLSFIKWVGGPLLLVLLGIGAKLLADVGKLDGKVDGQSSRLDRIEKALEKLVDNSLKVPAASGDGVMKIEKAAERIEGVVSAVTETVRTRFRIDAEREIHGTGVDGEGKVGRLVFKVQLDPLMPSQSREAIAGKVGSVVILYPADDHKAPEPGSVMAQLHVAAKGDDNVLLDVYCLGPVALDRFRTALAPHPKGLAGYATFDIGKRAESRP